MLAAAVGPVALAVASQRTAPPAFAGTAPAAASILAQFAGPLLTLAALLAAMLLCELAVDVVKLRRVKRRASPLGTVAIRGARIGTSRTVSTPTAIGYLHPAVVLPEGFRARVDEREWDAVVAHECAHLARGDDWAKALQSAVLRACWWLPGLWILSRALDLERELASDERAAHETGPRRYAACLLRLATDRGSELAPAFGGRRSHVAIRVERLLRPVADGGPLLRAIALGAFTAAAFAVVALAVLAVPGTAPHPAAATAAAHHSQVVLAHTALRHAVPRVAARIRRHAAKPNRAPGVVAYVSPARTAPIVPVARAPRAPFKRAERPARRADAVAHVRRAVPVRPELTPVETLAYAAPRRTCRTCFGPLRSPDDAVAPQSPSFTPPAAHASAAAAAVAADDPTSGPVSLGADMIWFRFQSRTIQGPN